MKRLITNSTAILLLMLLFDFFAGCIKRCCTGPLFYNFTILNANAENYFIDKPSVKIFTLEGQTKKYFNYASFKEDTAYNAKYKYIWSIPYGIEDTFKRNYFLELPGGDIDTLYLDVRKGANVPGNVFQSNFNGKPIAIDDQSIQYWQIHLLKK